MCNQVTNNGTKRMHAQECVACRCAWVWNGGTHILSKRRHKLLSRDTWEHEKLPDYQNRMHFNIEINFKHIYFYRRHHVGIFVVQKCFVKEYNECLKPGVCAVLQKLCVSRNLVLLHYKLLCLINVVTKCNKKFNMVWIFHE